MRKTLVVAFMLAGAIPPAASGQERIFEQDFEDPNWMDNWVICGDLGITMLDADNVVQFRPDEGSLGYDDVQGLAFDSNTNTLYGTDTAGDGGWRSGV